jgi:cyclophilin family peptidyl-prolyl cis-trans isomerase
MKRHVIASICIAMVAVGLLTVPAQAVPIVRLQFNLQSAEHDGNVYIRLFEQTQPETTANFLAYTNASLYNDSFFHRYVPGFVLQGGGFDITDNVYNDPNVGWSIIPDPIDLDGDPETPNPTVINEPGRSNVYGTVAMAKLGGDPDSATNQFFFNLGDNSANLDSQNGGFTVFAEVLGDGMDYMGQLVNALGTYNFNPDQATYEYDQDGNPIAYVSDEPDGIRDPGPFTETPYYSDSSGWTPVYLNDTEVMDIMEGDANHDYLVNEADLAWLADSWKQGPGYRWSEGDFTGDGLVDEADLAWLADNWGADNTPPAVVPEPASMTLLTIGTAVILGRRRPSG